MVLYRSEAEGFEIIFPEGWTVHHDVGDVAVLFAAPGYPDALSVHVYVDDSAEPWTLEDWVAARFADLGATLGVDDVQEWLVDQGPTSLGSDDAWFIHYAATMHPEEVLVIFVEIIAVSDGRGFIVTLASPNEPVPFPTFGAMLTSFEVLGQGG